MMKTNSFFTIGYSNRNLPDFITILKQYQVEAVADVRSQPYSKFNPDFNYENLKTELPKFGLKYFFLGKGLGARREEPGCYINGKVSYSRAAETESFKMGIEKLLKGIEKMRIALLCAEKDPIDCHRFVLICHHLASKVENIQHIIGNNLEDNRETEKRLLAKYKLTNMELFRTDSDALEDAYWKQEEKIAYKAIQEEGLEKTQ